MQLKDSIDQLALFGGPPSFTQTLYVGRPNIGNPDRLLARIKDILDCRWLTNNGPLVQEFEAKIAAVAGVKHCIAMCNATVALEIAIRAVGMTGEVIVPSFTFIATAHSLQWQEITPVFCDIDPSTHTIDPGRIEALITPRTSGIIGVHLWGRGCDTVALSAIARRHHLKLLFDAAHAFGCSHNNRMIGSFGDAEVFSFHATKFLNTFEGGAVVTNNDELAAKIRLMTNFGFAGYDNVIYIGTNGKMGEMSAAMGLTSLESMEEFITVNRRNYDAYRKGLEDIPGVSLIDYDSTEKLNYQYIILEIDASVAGIHRDRILDILHAENVLARRYFFPGCHRMEPYRSYFPHAGLLLPNTDRLSSRILVLPTGTAVSADEILRLCNLIRLAVTNGRAIQQKVIDNARRKELAA